jgi:hypothetical protein
MNKHTATLPDGTTATRNSDSRIYTVAIVKLFRTNDDRRYLASLVERYEGYIDSYRDTEREDDKARWAKYRDEYAQRLAETPADQVRYAVISWSSNEATARKRLKVDERLVPVTMVQSKPRGAK